ncbi:MAG: hypothetical protein OSB09_11610 [Planctomycetota bacterium]|nr:hypothetical protein [Planctomycetota bacterium]
MRGRELDELKDMIPGSGEIILTILAIIALVVGARIIAGILDKVRIERTIQKQGNQLVSTRWTPFAKGWLGSKNERLYEVIWIEPSGKRICSTVKTGMLAGTYFSDPHVDEGNSTVAESTARSEDSVRETTRSGDLSALEEENQRLRQEINHLRRDLDQLREN